MAKWEGNDYSDVDVEGLFTAESIDYKTSGKNISAGWIGTNCPFCGEQNYHCGVNLDSKRYSCWVCSASGTILKLVAVKIKTTYAVGNKIIDKHRGFRYEAPVRTLSPEVILPSHLSPLGKQGRTYLENRGFNADEIEEKYLLQQSNIFSNLKIDNHVWDFKCRIFIPVIIDHEIVTYTGRDWTDQQDPKYQNAPIEAGTILTSECVYNIDSVVDKALIVEGPTDVWKLGDEAIATLGVKFSHAQIKRIIDKRPKVTAILFDQAAEQSAGLLASALNPFLRNLSVYIVEEQDPGSMNMVDAHKLKYDLLYG